MSDAAEWEEFLSSVPAVENRRSDRFRTLAKCEAMFGLIATFFLGYGPAVVLVLVSLFSLLMGEWSALAAAIGPAIVSTCAAMWVSRAAGQALAVCYPELDADGELPLVRLAATSQPAAPREFAVEIGLLAARLPLAVRVVAALWWSLHFAAGFLVAVAAHRWVADAFDRPGSAVVVLLPLAIHFAFNVAANLYLILSVGALSADESLLRRLWSVRFAIDAAVTLSAIAILH